ncbi:TPA: hypothetical protein ACSP6G_000836 [Staphylococcus aureus]
MDLTISEILKVVVDKLEYTNFDIYDIDIDETSIVIHLEDLIMLNDKIFNDVSSIPVVKPVATLTIDKAIDTIHAVKSFVEFELYKITKDVERKRLTDMLDNTKTK